MINVYAKNVGGIWFGVACDREHVFGTSFAVNKQEALRSLLARVGKVMVRNPFAPLVP